jgi:hypothetical protein
MSFVGWVERSDTHRVAAGEASRWVSQALNPSYALVLQPIQVKAFGRVHLHRAKNDGLDTVLIAAYAAAIDPTWVAPDPCRASPRQEASDLR